MATFVSRIDCHNSFRGIFIQLSRFRGHENQAPRTKEAIANKNCPWRFVVPANSFKKLPGQPLAYWISERLRDVVANSSAITSIADARQGLATADNNRFTRRWFEVDLSRIMFNAKTRAEALESGQKWFPYNKGGDFRRWYGNCDYVVNWKDDGKEIRGFVDANGKLRSRPQNMDSYFREAVSWSDITSSANAFRYYEHGFIFDACAHSAFITDGNSPLTLLSYLNTTLIEFIANLLNPTMHFHVGYFKKLPCPERIGEIGGDSLAKQAVDISRHDWNSYERSWSFDRLPMLLPGVGNTIKDCLAVWDLERLSAARNLKEIEETNNRRYLEALNLIGEISPLVADEQITLTRPDREEDIKRLLSYTIGCMMGRYSLDKPGLIYAHSGNQGFDPSQYKTFRTDDDGIIPLLEADWGIRDDATNRIVEFIGVAWPKDHLEENLKFVADSLGPAKGEQPRDTIRRYLATGFYKHHLSMYKKRPIYWLFSSGKQRAFQCLVYLHRYHEGTLARMRTEYVIPLQGQIAARIEQLEGDKAKATSTSHRNKIQKEQDKLKKQQAELNAFEEKLKHYADMRISLDLDDGVKVNYGKFGDLLAEVKAICGSKDEG